MSFTSSDSEMNVDSEDSEICYIAEDMKQDFRHRNMHIYSKDVSAVLLLTTIEFQSNESINSILAAFPRCLLREFLYGYIKYT